MAFGSPLLSYRHVLLAIFQTSQDSGVCEGYTTNVYETFGQVKILMVASCFVELHQSKLYFLMSGRLVYRSAFIVGWVSVKEYLVDMLCVLFGYIQEFTFTGSLVICDGCLIHVTHVVEFVAMLNRCIALISAPLVQIGHRRLYCQEFI